MDVSVYKACGITIFHDITKRFRFWIICNIYNKINDQIDYNNTRIFALLSYVNK